MVGGSAAALALAAVTHAGAAMAQAVSSPSAPADSGTVEQVVVTGSSIRGVAPVGSNLVTMNQEEMLKTGSQTVGQMLAKLPQIEGMGNSGRATAGSSNGGVGVSVYIHQLGANGSNSTLVLLDGHRFPHSGVTNYLVNPSNVPAPMIERIEVLAEGASAVYGSDAVAGVVNFITRRRFDGVEARAQYEFADGMKSYQVGLLGGKTWDTGAVVLAATYTVDGQLLNTDRPWTNPLVQPQRAEAVGLPGTGATNFGNFNCNPASIQPNATGNIYPSATSTTSVVNSAANSLCTNWAYGAILPEDTRTNAMIRFYQEVTDQLTFGVDAVISQRRSQQIQSRGTLTATAFGPGHTNPAQVNPFYINPPGVTATRQQVRYNFDELLGPGATSNGSEFLTTASSTIDYRINDDWSVNFLSMWGRADNTAGENRGLVSTPLALLALNGTTQAGGSTTTTSIPGLNSITLNLPLTAANALDVWNPAATNRTSATVRQQIVNNDNLSRGIYSNQQYRLAVQGAVFTLPAGPVRVAVGIEQLKIRIEQKGTRPQLNAGAGSASQLFQFDFRRSDLAEYAEANIPVISPEMNIPLARKVDLSLAIRHDDYSDFGATTNPKASINWDVVEGLRLRGNVSTSFVAPPLNLVGAPYGLANFSNVSGGGPQGSNVPVSAYPLVAQMGIAGCTATSATCNISTLQGINSSTGDVNAIAQEGRGWSVGIDFTPTFVPGLTTAATLWNTDLIGGMTAPQFGARVTVASLQNALTFYPNCATPEQIAAFASQAPQTSVFPACVQFTYRSDTSNYLTYYAQGVDLYLAYRRDVGALGALQADWNLSLLTKFDEGFAYKKEPEKSQTFSALNTQGFASAFPSVKTNWRGHLGWELEGLSADFYVNYTGSYRNVNGTARLPVQSNAAGVYEGVGGDVVDRNITYDAHLGYDFSDGWMDGTRFSVSVKNLTDKEPPYFNTGAGFDALVANPIGRTVTMGVTKRF